MITTARRGEDGDDGSNDVTTVIRDDDYDGNDDGEDYDSDNQPTLAVLLDHWWHPVKYKTTMTHYVAMLTMQLVEKCNLSSSID